MTDKLRTQAGVVRFLAFALWVAGMALAAAALWAVVVAFQWLGGGHPSLRDRLFWHVQGLLYILGYVGWAVVLLALSRGVLWLWEALGCLRSLAGAEGAGTATAPAGTNVEPIGLAQLVQFLARLNRRLRGRDWEEPPPEREEPEAPEKNNESP